MSYANRMHQKVNDYTLRMLLEKLEFDEPHRRIMVIYYGRIVGIDTPHNLLNCSSEYFTRFLEYQVDERANERAIDTNMLYITL